MRYRLTMKEMKRLNALLSQSAPLGEDAAELRTLLAKLHGPKPAPRCDMTTVFVYGTLKRGYGNWARLLQDRDGVTFLGDAVSIEKNFVMNDVGFPLMFDIGRDNGSYVVGELFEVDDEALADLDRLEGHPRFYCRELRRFFNRETGRVAEAWVYLNRRESKTNPEAWVMPRDYHLNWVPVPYDEAADYEDAAEEARENMEAEQADKIARRKAVP